MKSDKGPPDRDAVVSLYRKIGDKTAVAKALGVSRNTVIRYCREEAGTDQGGEPEVTLTRSDKDDVATGRRETTVWTDKPIRTMQDAIRAAEVDTSIWYVRRWEATAYTVPMKLQVRDDGGRRKSDRPIMTQQYRVWLALEPIAPRPVLAALDAIYERMAKRSPRFPSVRKVKVSVDEEMAVFCLFDAHFGKLAWAPETNENYDLKIAERLFRDAVEDLLRESSHRKIGSILMPLGNDFFHIDGPKNQTAAGTPQDTDGRYAKIVETGLMAYVWAVDRMRQIAPTKVILVPGNHDPLPSYHTARTLGAYYRNDRAVEVDYRPLARKYVFWGGALIGLTHGNEEKHDALPGLMANEMPKEWADSLCRHWLIGHMHRAKRYQTAPLVTRDGVQIHVLRSLAGTDAWHFKRGYVARDQAAEAYWYRKGVGYVGHAIAPVRGNR